MIYWHRWKTNLSKRTERWLWRGLMVEIGPRPPKPENRVEMNMRGQSKKARSGETR